VFKLWVMKEENRNWRKNLLYKNWCVFASQMFEQICLNVRANFIFLKYSKIHFVYVKIIFWKKTWDLTL